MAGADPYEILGVERAATLEEVRAAFHKAVLQQHPDTCPDADRADAARKVSELIGAYRSISRSMGSGEDVPEVRVFSPQDFAQWEFPGSGNTRPAYNDKAFGHPRLRKRALPTVNEPKVFACFWVVAMVLAVAAAPLAVSITRAVLPGAADPADPVRGGPLLAVLLVPVAVYAAVVTAALVGLVLSRKAVWLIVRFGARMLRALPGVPADPELPPQPSRRRIARDGEAP